MIKILFSLSCIQFIMTASLFATPEIVAHRGSSQQAPENTLAAFELAWKQGADIIEIDVRLTKDSHVICIHDANTKRTGRSKLDVAKSTLSELQKLDVGSFKSKDYAGTHIPTLKEVLASVPKGKKVFIEIKSGAETIDPILKLIAQSSLENEQVAIISFKEKILLECKKRAPHIYTSWLCNIKKQKNGQLKPSFESVLNTLKSHRINGLSSSHHQINAEKVQTLKQQGFDCHVWTINDTKIAQKMTSLGVDSITTDVPHKFTK